MDWDAYSDDFFKACISGITKINPSDSPREWKLCWDLLLHWKEFQEEKCEVEKLVRGSVESASRSEPEEPGQEGKESAETVQTGSGHQSGSSAIVEPGSGGVESGLIL